MGIFIGTDNIKPTGIDKAYVGSELVWQSVLPKPEHLAGTEWKIKRTANHAELVALTRDKFDAYCTIIDGDKTINISQMSVKKLAGSETRQAVFTVGIGTFSRIMVNTDGNVSFAGSSSYYILTFDAVIKDASTFRPADEQWLINLFWTLFDRIK